ncbi:MAG: SNF2-related protein [Acidimicrobiales bacterium]|nr:SNF2-related protein [Acidimicrobiales bacterium]
MTVDASFSIDVDERGLIITVENPDAKSWRSFADAAADVSHPLGSRWRIPTWAVASLTWWWATSEARDDPPSLSDRAIRVMSSRADRAGALAGLLSADMASWSTWPVVIEGPNGPVVLNEPADYGFSRVLLSFQASQAARLLRSGDGCNFSVPGSGKTTVAYAVWGAHRVAGLVDRTVVVAPLSAHESWIIEANDCFEPTKRPRLSVGPFRPSGDVVLVNYEALQAPAQLDVLEAWLRGAPSMVIFDESHRAKAGRAGLRGAAAIRLADSARHRYVLTGTPAPNGRGDLAAMFDLAWPGSGAALLRDHRSSRCFVRATKSDLGLPPQRMEVERIPMSGAHQRLYSAMANSAEAALAEPSTRADLARIGRIVMLLVQAATDPAALLDPAVPLAMSGDRPDADLEALARQAAAAVVPGKFVRVRQIVDSNAAAGRKTLVWSCFRHHVDALARLLTPHQPAVVTGDLPQGVLRNVEIDRFRNDPDCSVLIATPQTLGEGVSLHQTCQHQIHVDRTYNAGLFLQSLDRTHRLGLAPRSECSATVLVTEGTIDERVEARLAAKVAAMAAMLDDPDLVGLSVPDVDRPLDTNALLLGPDASDALADLFGSPRSPT